MAKGLMLICKAQNKGEKMNNKNKKTNNRVKAVVGAIFIAPISVLLAEAGNITYSSGIATGISFIAIFGAVVEIIGFLGIVASAYTLSIIAIRWAHEKGFNTIDD